MPKISKKLVGSVLVADPNGGDPLVLVAGADVPEGVELGAHVLEPEKSADEKAAAKAAKKAAKSGGKTAGETPAGSTEEQPLTAPPQTGRGSGDAAWREYATAATAKAGLSVEFADDAKKADIIEALKGANIPVE